MNSKGLESVFLKNMKLCYLDADEIACNVVEDLISVFYELGIGDKVDGLMQQAIEKRVD